MNKKKKINSFFFIRKSSFLTFVGTNILSINNYEEILHGANHAFVI